MDYIVEVLKSKNRGYLFKEVDERKDLLLQMVGTLYPSILGDEISKILNRLALLGTNNNKTKFLTDKL